MTFHATLHLMNSAQTPAEWEASIAKVRAANGGSFPLFWYDTLFKHMGITERPATRWGG